MILKRKNHTFHIQFKRKKSPFPHQSQGLDGSNRLPTGASAGLMGGNTSALCIFRPAKKKNDLNNSAKNLQSKILPSKPLFPLFSLEKG
jgi:hypothetical protein